MILCILKNISQKAILIFIKQLIVLKQYYNEKVKGKNEKDFAGKSFGEIISDSEFIKK